jgi:hypothetical protein
MWTLRCAIVAEAQNVQVSATRRYGRDALRVFLLLACIERVKETAIEHRRKFTIQQLQLKSVCDQERNSKLATQRLFPRHFYRGCGYVNSDYIEARRREEERVLACAASDIENRSNQIMSCDEPLEGGLVSPDVPWWGPVVI